MNLPTWEVAFLPGACPRTWLKPTGAYAENGIRSRVDSKPLVLLHTEIKTPPLSPEARREIGYLLRALQEGDHLSMRTHGRCP